MTGRRSAARLGLVALGVALGLFAEWAALRRPHLQPLPSASDYRLAIADFAVGCSLLAGGSIISSSNRETHIGTLLSATGLTWFLGTFSASGIAPYSEIGSVFATLHRAALAHALLSYPSGRLRTGVDRIVVAGGYLYGAVEPIGQSGVITITFAAALVVAAALRMRSTTGPERRARAAAFGAALAFAAALVAAGAIEVAGASDAAAREVLWLYLAVIFVIAIAVTLDFTLGQWTPRTVAGLVVDLGGRAETGTLGSRIANALGDRSLEIAYWIPDEARYVAEDGRAVELPPPGSGREVTMISAPGGEPVAALVHDAAVLRDADLVASVAAAARIAVSNLRLRAEIERRVEELDASRRRIVTAADAQRRRLEQAVHDGAQIRLTAVANLLDVSSLPADQDVAALFAQSRAEVEAAQAELQEFARGIHPRILTEGGLAGAVRQLADRASIDVEVSAPAERYEPAVEAAVYFVCSEALANIAKHARASRASIELRRVGDRLFVDIRDDGAGGAAIADGTGLLGLRDRVEALGGDLRIQSPPNGGTHLSAELPVTRIGEPAA